MKLIIGMLAVPILAAFVAACGGGNASPTATVSGPEESNAGPAAAGEASCAPAQGETEEIDAAKLLFEYQSTDDDTGVHGLFDTSGFAELCVFAPDGRQVLAIKPQGQLEELGMGGIFFESREPEEAEVAQEAILADFPEGSYEVAGTSHEGTGLAGSALLTHDIPVPPAITFPAEGDVVDPESLVITWEPVSETVKGDAAQITGYEVIVTKEVEDPHGFSQPILSAHVLPSVTSLTIPSEFLETGTEYELEVIALEESGNQTITVVFFETE